MDHQGAPNQSESWEWESGEAVRIQFLGSTLDPGDQSPWGYFNSFTGGLWYSQPLGPPVTFGIQWIWWPLTDNTEYEIVLLLLRNLFLSWAYCTTHNAGASLCLGCWVLGTKSGDTSSKWVNFMHFCLNFVYSSLILLYSCFVFPYLKKCLNLIVVYIIYSKLSQVLLFNEANVCGKWGKEGKEWKRRRERGNMFRGQNCTKVTYETGVTVVNYWWPFWSTAGLRFPIQE